MDALQQQRVIAHQLIELNRKIQKKQHTVSKYYALLIWRIGFHFHPVAISAIAGVVKCGVFLRSVLSFGCWAYWCVNACHHGLLHNTN